MCRIGAIINGENKVANLIGELHKYGGNYESEHWKEEAFQLVHTRFDVTSDNYAQGLFPLITDRYVFHFNGEVYGWKDEVFIDSEFDSDSHFAIDIIQRNGVDSFFKDVDFQGSYQVFDKQEKKLYIAVDQLNTAGYFYATHKGVFIGASEYTVVNRALDECFPESQELIPILIVKDGTYITVDSSVNVSTYEYRPHYRSVWSGSIYSKDDFQARSENLEKEMYESVRLRIPREGRFGVLCSGGVDSSLILTNTVRILRASNQLDRIRIFTLGNDSIKSDEQNDLFNVKFLLKELGIDEEKYLDIIPASFVEELREQVYRQGVFCDHPTLIAPMPTLNTSVRHIVTMSSMLSWIIQKYPEIKVVLSGDASDEIFAGYNSMRQGVKTAEEMKQRVVEKLNDLPLNDASRVVLSAFHGSQYVAKEILKLKNTHPVEVRLPFTSHKVLEILIDCHADYMVGRHKGDVLPKFILRYVAKLSTVPEKIAFRKKIPFHEGGVGLKNSEHDSIENRLISEVDVSSHEQHKENLERLGFLGDAGNTAMYFIALRSGLARLMKGNVFRQRMPDMIYSTEFTGSEYTPESLIDTEMLR